MRRVETFFGVFFLTIFCLLLLGVAVEVLHWLLERYKQKYGDGDGLALAVFWIAIVVAAVVTAFRVATVKERAGKLPAPTDN